MYLTPEEESILNGEKGEVAERMLRLLSRLGEIYGADKMIPIGLSGCSACKPAYENSQMN